MAVSTPSSNKNKKGMDFELNLIPFIDLLSVCICFLLITAVWIQIGTINTKQAVGGQSQSETEKKPTLNVAFQPNGDLVLEAKDAKLPAHLNRVKVSGLAGKINLPQLDQVLAEIKKSEPALTTALFRPQAASVYEDIIDVMDQFKKKGLINLGVNPL
jgi:biopolymer transport protein TolR